MAVITGASSPIRDATALQLKKEGARIALVDKAAPLEATKKLETFGIKWDPKFQADVTNDDEVGRAFDNIIMTHGKIDILVNVVTSEAGADYSKIRANLRGIAMCTKKAMETMQRQCSIC